MKIEDYDCVKMKHRAQERVSMKTKKMTPGQLLAYYHRVGKAARKRQMASSAKIKTTISQD